MILTLSWLKNHLSTKASINEIIEKLTNIGLEVEGVGPVLRFLSAWVVVVDNHVESVPYDPNTLFALQ